MTVNFKKSLFCRDKVPFVGYNLTTSGLTPDDSTISAILKYPSPTNRKQLKQFLGGINYYNKFVDKFAHTAQPLMRLTSKKVKFNWTEAEEQSFQQIKRLFLHTNVLSYPCPSKEYFLQTDSSDSAIGGHLFQLRDNGDKAAIIFISRTLKKSELRYTTTEKELLAIVYCLQKVRHYVLNAKLTILTDHNALTFLHSCKLLNARLTRWILALQDYQFEINHCKGNENSLADALSRIKIDDPSTVTHQNPSEIILAIIQRHQYHNLSVKLQNLSQLQMDDPEIGPIFHQIINAPADQPCLLNENYKVMDNIIFRKHRGIWLIWIPESIVNDLIWDCHLYYLHCGSKKCMDLLKDDFIFRNMHRRIRKTLSCCDTCQRCKHDNHPCHGVASGIKCIGKNDLWAVDLIGPLPRSQSSVKYVFIILDVFTKFVKLYTIKSATAKTVVTKMFDIHIPVYGKPNAILQDHGTQFKSKLWQEKLDENHIRAIFNPVHHPMTNMAERPIREIKRCLRTYCSDNHRSWAKFIPLINTFLNEVQQETTGYSPNELHLGVKDRKFWEEIVSNPFKTDIPLVQKMEFTKQRIRNVQAARAAKLNAKRKQIEFNVGDLVLVRGHPQSNFGFGETAKLFTVYFGPLTIQQRIGNSTYLLTNESDKTFGPYHISSLKRYHQ